MKNQLTCLFVLLFTLLTGGIVLGQNQPINFESGGFGASWTWKVFENDDNPPLEIVANPDMSGINTSATVAKFTARLAGQDYAGCESLHGSDIGTFTLDATNSTVKIMVWKTVISDVGLKFVLPNNEALIEIKVANTLINEWEELTFDFSSRIGHPATVGQDQIVVFPDFADRAQENIIYFDNITFSSGNPIAEPTVPAPTPPVRDPANVISLFSEAYTNVPVDTWRTDWSAAILTDVTVEGNPTKKYSQLDFVGIETVNNQLNISDMTHVHLDVWSSNFTFFGIKIVDFGANGVYDGGGDDVEHQVDFTSPTQSQWVSLDIPLSDFTGLTTRNHIAQYILVAQPTGSTIIYIDNFYFYNSATDVKEITGTIPSDYVLEQNYPNPFNPSTIISFSLPEASNVSLKIYDMLGQEVTTLVNEFLNAGTFEISFDASNLPTGIYTYSLTAGDFQSVKKMMLIK